LIEIIYSVHSKQPQSGCTHPCVTSYAGYPVCTTWLRLLLHEPNKNCDQSINKYYSEMGEREERNIQNMDDF